MQNLLSSTDAMVEKLEANNIFLIAKRTVEQQDLLYMSLKFINNIWTLAELKVATGTVQVSSTILTTLLLF